VATLRPWRCARSAAWRSWRFTLQRFAISTNAEGVLGTSGLREASYTPQKVITRGRNAMSLDHALCVAGCLPPRRLPALVAATGESAGDHRSARRSPRRRAIRPRKARRPPTSSTPTCVVEPAVRSLIQPNAAIKAVGTVALWSEGRHGPRPGTANCVERIPNNRQLRGGGRWPGSACPPSLQKKKQLETETSFGLPGPPALLRSI